MRILYFFILLTLASCSSSRFVKPLEKKQHAANVSLGGPLIGFGNTTIPIPFITATYGYGIDSTFTGFGSINITSALYGNFQCELGATKQIIKQKKFFPAISVTPQLNMIYRNSDAKKIYPQMDINAFWEYGKKKHFFYAGISNWFELSSKKAFGIKQQNHWIFSPTVGNSFNTKKWSFVIETKIIAPHLSNENIVVDYKTPLKDKGAMGIYFGCTRKF